MKKIIYIVLLFFGVVICTSCSSNNNQTTNSTDNTETPEKENEVDDTLKYSHPELTADYTDDLAIRDDAKSNKNLYGKTARIKIRSSLKSSDSIKNFFNIIDEGENNATIFTTETVPPMAITKGHTYYFYIKYYETLSFDCDGYTETYLNIVVAFYDLAA